MEPNNLRLFRQRVLACDAAAMDGLLSLPAGTWAAWEQARRPNPGTHVADALLRHEVETLLAGISGEELFVVAQLMARVTQQEVELKNLQGMGADAATGHLLKEQAQRRVRVLHELHTRAYGRVVWVRDLGTSEEQVYRFTQANEGFPNLRVVQRQLPLAGELIPAQIGDTVELPNGREVEVTAVIDLERFPASQLLGSYDTFAALQLVASGLDGRREIGELKAAVAALGTQIRAALGIGEPAALEVVPERPRVRGRDEQLSASFFTRSTHAQEKLMRRGPGGLTVVLGVAGSGKTSVALGRTKFACDAAGTGADPEFFRTNTAVGFVLSEQLSGYLRRAMSELMLLDMQVQEYGALRKDLVLHRQLDQGGTYTHDGGRLDLASAVEGKMAWLRASDLAMAQVLTERLRDLARTAPGEHEEGRRRLRRERTEAQSAALQRVWSVFRTEIEHIATDLQRDSDGWQFRLQGLALRIDRARATFADRLERDPAWTGSELSDARQGVRAAVLQRVLKTLRFADLYADAVQRPIFSEELARRLGGAGGTVDQAIERVRGRRLSDADVDTLLALTHLASLGYRGRDDEKDPISHLAERGAHSQVFIDEFQDFSEVQLFLMGALADRKYRSVTVVGDFCQQLTSGQRVDLSACFPWASAGDRAPIMLLENKRQRPALARFSQRFREVVLRDPPAPVDASGKTGGDLPRVITAEDVTQAVYDEVISLPRDASVAVVCPDMRLAETLHAELSADLAEAWRETRVARHAELTSRQFIHFTEPIQTKGLEFDAVVVVDPAGFDLQVPTRANGCYVAVSRPRERLSIITRGLPPREIRQLIDENLAVLIDAPR